MADKKCKAVYFPIPNKPQDKAISTASEPNKLKIETFHDDGGASLWGLVKGV